MRRNRLTLALALAGAGLLAGCALPDSGEVTAAAPPMPGPADGLLTSSAAPASAALVDYYARVQEGLLSEGMLRTESAPKDAPFSARDLTRDFLKVALYEEYSDLGGRLIARPAASKLHRWTKPVTISLEFGHDLSTDQRLKDGATVSALLGRIRKDTGLSITQVSPGHGNFRVFVVNETERRAMGPRIKALMPDISPTALNTIINLPRSTYCLVFAATDPRRPGSYAEAIAVIRSEHPDLMRTSCYHEEITQGFGLANDYPLARPSLFNDDEEFALLTTHDELLLKMLYDKRLTPGMTEAQARPVVEQIAQELLGGNV
jgi:hypothetical protein